MDILQTVKDLLFWIVIISVCIIFLRAAINTFIHPREYDGTLLIGKGSDGRKIYRFEIDDKAFRLEHSEILKFQKLLTMRTRID